MGVVVQPGDCSLCIASRRLATKAASVVFPVVFVSKVGVVFPSTSGGGKGGCVPEPGIPETAIKRRFEAGVCWYFSFYGVIFTVAEYVDVPVLTPGLFDQSVYLVLHLSALIRGNGMCFCSVQEVNKEIVKAVVEICPSAPPDYRA